MLEDLIKKRREQRDILLMTHIVLGYPSFAASLELIDAMVESGVDLIELQIPFSEPIADGPVILQASQRALANGASVEKFLAAAAAAAARHPIPFLLMTYYNIPYTCGVQAFATRMREAGLCGAIIPDLPPEEGAEYLAAMREAELDHIFIFTPKSTEARLAVLASHARGFVYCVARKGVTGAETSFSSEMTAYLQRCRKATSLPLAVGFGLKDRADIAFLEGKADIAVIGSETLRLLDREGIEAVPPFLKSLRA